MFHNFSWRLWFLICFAITTSCDWHRQTLNDISSIKNNKQPVLHHLARISFTCPAEFIQLPCRDFTWFINNWRFYMWKWRQNSRLTFTLQSKILNNQASMCHQNFSLRFILKAKFRKFQTRYWFFKIPCYWNQVWSSLPHERNRIIHRFNELKRHGWSLEAGSSQV